MSRLRICSPQAAHTAGEREHLVQQLTPVLAAACAGLAHPEHAGHQRDQIAEAGHGCYGWLILTWQPLERGGLTVMSPLLSVSITGLWLSASALVRKQ